MKQPATDEEIGLVIGLDGVMRRGPRKKRKRTSDKTATSQRTEYRLMDPATGLYWSTSSPEAPEFNAKGKGWATLDRARYQWSEYNFYRALAKAEETVSLIPPFPFPLVLREFIVTIEEATPPAVHAPEMGPALRFRLATMNQHHSINQFVKNLCQREWDFEYIIEFRGNDEDVPQGVVSYWHKIDEGWTGRPSEGDYFAMAFKTERDMIFTRVALAGKPIRVWDRDANKLMDTLDDNL